MTSEVSGLVRRDVAEAQVGCTDVRKEEVFRLMVVPTVIAKASPEN
jgi:hypothetical protein